MSVQIDNVLHQLDQMPSLPAVAAKILHIVLEDEFSLPELATLVESDPTLTLKVLNTVNNAERGGHPVSSVSHAFPLIGMRPLRILLLSVIVKDGLVENGTDQEGIHKELWTHSLACAIFAGLLAERTYPQLRNEAFAAGMLHDLGKIFLLVYFPEKYLECRERIVRNNEPASVAEERIFGTNHTTIGRELAKKWHLPQHIEQAIWRHHLDSAVLGQEDGLQEMLLLIKGADYLAHEALVDTPQPSMTRDADSKRIINSLGLDPQDMLQIRDGFSREFKEHISLFDLESDGTSLFYQALQRANERLARIALELDRKNESLTISDRFSTAVIKAGIAFNTVETVGDFFPTLPKYLGANVGIQRGIVYWINRSGTFLEGILWKSNGFERLFSSPMNGAMEPVPKSGTPPLSPALHGLIKTAGERGRGCGDNPDRTDPRRFSIAQGLTIFPFQANGFMGEVCLGREGTAVPPTNQELMGLSQFVALIETTLDRLRVNRDLCRRADELSAALWKNRQVNLQLMQTERLAAVGQLAAGAAHEINNPLAIISARTQMIEAREENDKKKKELKQIHGQIERISTILTNLMGFARPPVPSKERVDINQLLDKVLDLVAPPMLKQHIQVERNYARDLPLLHADGGQLEQVFLNFCINAQHAMEEGGGTLRVKTGRGGSPKWIGVAIEDSGVGISENHLAKIFDPFFTTKEQGKGTGLGLSTAYGIVTNHYGKIDVRSVPGEGTRILVSLPVMDSQQDEPADARQADQGAVQEEQPDACGVRPRILVVDDEEHIREILTETLTGHGCRVDIAENGKQGLKKLTRHIYDLMLMDIRMPSYSGLDLLARIKNQIAQMPVFVITGLASSEEMDKALELGATKCIRKPFHIKSLIQDIRTVVSLP
ncbi:HDOD domain-containing protein [Desulfoplanes sp.]